MCRGASPTLELSNIESFPFQTGGLTDQFGQELIHAMIVAMGYVTGWSNSLCCVGYKIPANIS